MSVSKDKSTGKWMAQCRVTDWQGNSTHKKKRGFNTKKEAQEWEMQIKNQATESTSMLYSDFIKLYFEDMSHRLKKSTLKNKIYLIDTKITPTFGKMKLDSITPKQIRIWQNSLTSFRDENGKHTLQLILKP